jgi:hypothetical protein
VQRTVQRQLPDSPAQFRVLGEVHYIHVSVPSGAT